MGFSFAEERIRIRSVLHRSLSKILDIFGTAAEYCCRYPQIQTFVAQALRPRSMVVGGEFMMQRLRLTLVMTALLIVTIFCPVAYADQSEALIKALRKGDVKQVQELLKKGADVNAKDGHGSPALVLAAESDYRGRTELMKLLLEKGADVNAKTKGGWTALMEAALRGHVELVKLLLDKGADVNATDRDGATALITAAGRGHLDVVRLLADKGADANARTRSGHTALVRAEASGRADVVKFLALRVRAYRG